LRCLSSKNAPFSDWKAAPFMQLEEFPPLICVATKQEIELNYVFGIQRGWVLAPTIKQRR
jgi:hypothetical protein